MMSQDMQLDGQQDTLSWSVLGRSESDVRQVVSEIVDSSAESHWDGPERRVDSRYAYPNLITITPISDQNLSQTGESIQVVGKWLAERGLDFFHTSNLPFRRAVVTFDSREQTCAHMILNISWSRFLNPGWYDSGGRFTHVVRPVEATF